MLPMELVIHIFSYLGIKPTKRCKATTLKGKMCKNNTDNIESYSEFLCKNHKNVCTLVSLNALSKFPSNDTS